MSKASEELKGALYDALSNNRHESPWPYIGPLTPFGLVEIQGSLDLDALAGFLNSAGYRKVEGGVPESAVETAAEVLWQVRPLTKESVRASARLALEIAVFGVPRPPLPQEDEHSPATGCCDECTPCYEPLGVGRQEVG